MARSDRLFAPILAAVVLTLASCRGGDVPVSSAKDTAEHIRKAASYCASHHKTADCALHSAHNTRIAGCRIQNCHFPLFLPGVTLDPP